MNQNQSDLLMGLPGADRILEGLRDYRENRHTMPACLVRMARRRLAKAGFWRTCHPGMTARNSNSINYSPTRATKLTAATTP